MKTSLNSEIAITKECYIEKVAKFRYSEGREIVTRVFKLVSFRFNHNVIFLPENPRGDFFKTL